MRLAQRHPTELRQWLAWHAASHTFTAANGYGGYGKGYGTRRTFIWAAGGWNHGTGWGSNVAAQWGPVNAWFGPNSPKSAQKKKKRKVRMRDACARAEAAQAEFIRWEIYEDDSDNIPYCTRS
jgi:hypothetical protein